MITPPKPTATYANSAELFILHSVLQKSYLKRIPGKKRRRRFYTNISAHALRLVKKEKKSIKVQDVNIATTSLNPQFIFGRKSKKATQPILNYCVTASALINVNDAVLGLKTKLQTTQPKAASPLKGRCTVLRVKDRTGEFCIIQNDARIQNEVNITPDARVSFDMSIQSSAKDTYEVYTSQHKGAQK
jgi:hypothetical protein